MQQCYLEVRCCAPCDQISLYACKSNHGQFQAKLALNVHLMLHPCKDVGILRCSLFLWSHLVFSEGAMCLIASPLPISMTGCVLSEGTCRTTVNPLQPGDLDKGQPRLTRGFWSHCLGAREDLCLWLSMLLPSEYSNLFQGMIRLTPNRIYFCVFGQYRCTTFSLGRFAHLIKMIFDSLYIVPQSYINLVLSAVTAITDKASSTYVFHTIWDKHIHYSDKHGMIRNNIGDNGMMSFLKPTPSLEEEGSRDLNQHFSQ